MIKKQKALWMLLRRNVHDLEYSPSAQYKFHFKLTWLWFVTMIALPFLPTLWAHNVSALIIQEISLWANFATHFAGMSSAIAAKDSVPSVRRVPELDWSADHSPAAPLPPR